MPIPRKLLTLAALAGALVACILTAFVAAKVMERRSLLAVSQRMVSADLSFVSVETDGLQVHLRGTAPNEAARFRAVAEAGMVVDGTRIRDKMEVAPTADIQPPRFSVELLRNDDGISLIGLVPASTGHERLTESLSELVEEGQLTDMLETASYDAPEGWDEALDFGLKALHLLPRSKVSIAADRVAVTAIGDSEQHKRKLESDLARMAPEGLGLSIAISAPRPVITPFTLRFVIDDRGPRFDACSADTERARSTITAAAIAAGVQGKAACTVGLGVPTPRWAEAVSAGIKAVAALGKGSITFSDADVSLIADAGTPQQLYDRVVGDLDAELPDVFSLAASLPEKPADAPERGPAVFSAKLGEDGQLQLRGRLSDERMRNAVDAVARAHFGTAAVYSAARLDDTLPSGWPVRVLAGLEALAHLHHGEMEVQPDLVTISGVTGSTDASDAISRILSDKLGQSQRFEVSVTYDEAFDPLAALPTPEECVAEINRLLNVSKITFAPGSVDIDNSAAVTLDAVAEELKKCGEVRMEIGGHTDSQGRDEMNLQLSQSRAEAVLVALMDRRVPVSNLSAKGYGESVPVGDNETEDGREANRRIEFTLITDENAAAADEAIAIEDGTGDDGGADGETNDTGTTDAQAADVGADAGSGDGDAGSGDGDGADTADAATDPESPSFAPDEKTIRPKARPKTE